MIVLTRCTGAPIALEADLIERLDSTPDTIVTLADGKKYMVVESIADVVERIIRFRAGVLASVEASGGCERHSTLRVVSDDEMRA